VTGRPIAIVGGGITGLLAAAAFARAGRAGDVTLIEAGPALGGQYASRPFGQFGMGDFGMHVVYATGRADIDDLVLGMAPRDQVELRWGNDKDLAGIWWRGRLQGHSPFPDIRGQSDQAVVTVSVEAAIAADAMPAERSAASLLQAQFGAAATDAIHRPILRKLHRAEAEDLDPFVTVLTEMRRLVVHDEDQVRPRMADPAFRRRIAWPDQTTLPAAFRPNPVFALYPKRFGMGHWIDMVRDGLLARGVEILTGTPLAALERRGARVTALVAQNGRRFEDIERVVWTAGDGGLLALCGAAQGLPRPEFGHRIAYVWLRFAAPPRLGGVYYAYCYDDGFRTFRVTDPSGYCPAAVDERGWPVAVELWADDVAGLDPEALAVDELRRLGVIDEGAAPLAAGHYVGPPVPRFTRASMAALATVEQAAAALDLGNLDRVGVAPQAGRFFFPDIATHAIETCRATGALG